MDAVDRVAVLLIAGVLAWAYWRVSRPRVAFVIRITEGRPVAVSGMVTAAFLVRIRETAAANRFDHGRIIGRDHGGLIRLRFSSHIPDPARQQIRNWWATHGWRSSAAQPSRCS